MMVLVVYGIGIGGGVDWLVYTMDLPKSSWSLDVSEVVVVT